MDLILVFIVISIITNIVGAIKKQNEKQTGKKTVRSSASRGRGLRNLIDLIENKQYAADNKQQKRKLVAESVNTDDYKKQDRVRIPSIKNYDLSEKEKVLKVQEDTNTIRLTDLQKTIVMAEVLGKPKALKR